MRRGRYRPAIATAAPAEIVQNGWLWVPGPESEQPAPPTYQVEAADAAVSTGPTEAAAASTMAIRSSLTARR